MTPDITKINSWLLAFSLIACAPSAQAFCYKVTDPTPGKNHNQIPEELAKEYSARAWNMTNTGDQGAQTITFPVINIGSGGRLGALAPAGEQLSQTSLDITQGLDPSYEPNQILFKCDLSDADTLYELYATNGKMNLYGGKAASDVDNAYLTPATYIAFRLTHLKTGNYYTPYWQQRKLMEGEDYIVFGSNIYVKAMAFSGVTFELIKTYDYDGVPSRTPFSNNLAPEGVVTFKGNGINNVLTTSVLGSTNPGVNLVARWSLSGGSTTVIYGKTCTLGEFDQVVNLPPISVNDLGNGLNSVASFNVAIECEKGATSGTTSSDTNPPVAVGFYVTNDVASKKLGLQTGAGGITYLLDDNYGGSGVASGVGIRIYSSNNQALNLLSDNKQAGNGPDAGWYGFADLMSETGLTSSGGTTYAGTFTASLEQLPVPGLELKSGSVNARAQIIVSLQ